MIIILKIRQNLYKKTNFTFLKMEKLSIENICHELVIYVQKNILDDSVTITPETLFNQVGLDSMSIIELVLFIERKFKVAILEKDLIPDNLKSIRTLAECTFKYF